MTEQNHIYIVHGGLGSIDELANQLNMIFAGISGRLDQIEGLRGTSTVYSHLDLKGNQVKNIGDPSDSNDAVTLGHLNRALQIPVLGTKQDFLQSDISMPGSGTFYDGPGITLFPASWLLFGSVLVEWTGTTGSVTAKLWDGSNIFASAENKTTDPLSLAVSAVIEITENTAIRISAACSHTNASMKAATSYTTASGSSYLIALRTA